MGNIQYNYSDKPAFFQISVTNGLFELIFPTENKSQAHFFICNEHMEFATYMHQQHSHEIEQTLLSGQSTAQQRSRLGNLTMTMTFCLLMPTRQVVT